LIPRCLSVSRYDRMNHGAVGWSEHALINTRLRRGANRIW
jgi:hypothetical protein